MLSWFILKVTEAEPLKYYQSWDVTIIIDEIKLLYFEASQFILQILNSHKRLEALIKNMPLLLWRIIMQIVSGFLWDKGKKISIMQCTDWKLHVDSKLCSMKLIVHSLHNINLNMDILLYWCCKNKYIVL